MTPEAERFLDKARQCLADAQTYQPFVPRIAAREAYLAAFHAAQALVHDRTGAVAKTHRGVRTQFALLTKDQAGLDPRLREFLGQAYDLKSRSDYGTGAEATISAETARAAIEAADSFVGQIAALIG